MTKKREVRMFSTALRVETRADGDNEKSVLAGHAAVFNQRTNLGFFDEIIKPGAFRETLKEGADVRALVDHDPSRIVGRSKDGGKTGTLRMREDHIGLHVEIDVADTSVGEDLMKSVRRGDIDGMSFGFFVRSEGDHVTEEKSGRLLRTLTDLDLFDVSAVTYPAYEATDLGEKNSDQAQFEARSIANVYESMPEDLRERAKEAEARGETVPESDEEFTNLLRTVVAEEVRSALNEVIKPKEGKKEEVLPEKTEEVRSKEVDPKEESEPEGTPDVSKLVAQRKREILQLEHERSLV